MNAPLRISSAAAAPSHAPPTDAISTWLETLAVLLKMPSAKRDAIRDELDGHLRERVRDLMLTGQTEPDAVRTAIGELGDAVKLAERLRAAGRNPRRRLAMNLAVVGVAGAALLTSIVALNGGSALPARQPETAAAAKQPSTGTSEVWVPVELVYRFEAPAPQDLKSLKVSVAPTMTIEEFIKQISDAAGTPVVVRWKLLEAMNVGQGNSLPVETSLSNLSLREAFDLINEGIAAAGDGLDFRITDNRLTIATVAYFDKAETVLVAYDLQEQAKDRARQFENKSITDATKRVTEEVTHVIQELVQKDLWVDNGGDRASIAVYGTKLFVRAPKRFHPEIEWVISQLPVTQNVVEVPILDDVPLILVRPEVVLPEMLDPSKPEMIDPSKMVSRVEDVALSSPQQTPPKK